MAASATEALPVRRDEAGEPVLIVQLVQDGPVVVLDRVLLDRLALTLDSLELDGVAGVVVASGSEKVFVAGADLRAIRDLDDQALHEYLEFGSSVFARLHSLGVWTAAAINGAALGGGLELAMHCDGLIAAPGTKPYPVGLPEAGLSICPGWGGTNLLPARIDPAHGIERTATGEAMPFEQAVRAGMFDAVAESTSSLRSEAAAWVRGRSGPPPRDGAPKRWIGRDRDACALALDRVRASLPSTASAQAVAEAVAAGLDSGWESALATERSRLVALRNEPAGKRAIAAFFEKQRS